MTVFVIEIEVHEKVDKRGVRHCLISFSCDIPKLKLIHFISCQRFNKSCLFTPTVQWYMYYTSVVHNNIIMLIVDEFVTVASQQQLYPLLLQYLAKMVKIFL